MKELAYLLAGLGLLMVGFAALGWQRRLWSLAGRLHYFQVVWVPTLYGD